MVIPRSVIISTTSSLSGFFEFGLAAGVADFSAFDAVVFSKGLFSASFLESFACCVWGRASGK